jgi:hypothetical protein
MSNKKFTNLAVLLVSSVTEVVKKQCKAALKKVHIHDNDWDEIRDSSGKIMSLTVYVRNDDASAARIALKSIPGVIDVVIGTSFEPVCFLTQPLDLSTLTGPVIFQTIPGEIGRGKIKRVDYTIDNDQIDSTSIGSSTVAPYSVTWDSSSVGNGEIKVQAHAYDKKDKLLGVSPVYTLTTSNSSMMGFDGTEVSLSQFSTTTYFGDMGITFNSDETCTLSTVDGNTEWSLISFNTVPYYPPAEEVIVETRVKFNSPGITLALMFSAGAAPSITCNPTGDTYSLYGATPNGAATSPVTIADTDWHTLKIDSQPLVVNYYLDDVSIGSLEQNPDSTDDSLAFVVLLSQPNSSLTVDYVRWTKQL